MKKENQSTQDKILAAAEKEFLRKGYAGARTTSIAEEAGVTHAMLHYYFRTKQNLFEKIITENFGLLRNIMLDSIGDPALPLFDKLRSAIERHIEFIASHPELPRFMIGEVFSQPERVALIIQQLRKHSNQVVSSLQTQIDDYSAQGLCRRVDAAMLILDIVSLNIFAFIARPLVNPLLGGIMTDMEAFLEARKRENVETIMRKLII